MRLIHDSKDKCDLLKRENELLGKTQMRFTHDKEDIVEFLNIKVQEHERYIEALEIKSKKLEDEKSHFESKSQGEIQALKDETKNEIESLTSQLFKAKQDLSDLSIFSSQKVFCNCMNE